MKPAITPDEHTLQELTIDAGDGHALYVQDWGNKAAQTPIFYLHGGPGGCVKDGHKRLFDGTRQRVIFFDQRGCGQSTPAGSLAHNTTKDLVADITKIADQLAIKTCTLYGTSWGSTLALAYALAHPKRVASLVIGGIFTGSQKEIDWLDKGLFQTFYPEVWQAYLDKTPKVHHKDPSAYHFDQVLGVDVLAQKASGYAYECLEGGVVRLDDRFTPADFDTYDPSAIRIEINYLAQRCFMDDRSILDNAHRLTMPVHIVQGRYDMVCPPATAYELHQRIAQSRLYWALEGHAVGHEGNNIFKALLSRSVV